MPGLSLDEAGLPLAPGVPSLIVQVANVQVTIASSIVGAVWAAAGSSLNAQDSFIDANDATGVALAATDGISAGASLHLRACTVIGKVASESLDYVSDTILSALLKRTGETWEAPVWSARRQEGCVRFSFVPPGSITPRRFRCQPDLEIATQIETLEKARSAPLPQTERAAIRERVRAWLVPGFVSQQYGTPAYGQLLNASPLQIRRGAHDESEMGGFHLLFQSQRETNLRVRLDEYLQISAGGEVLLCELKSYRRRGGGRERGLQSSDVRSAQGIRRHLPAAGARRAGFGLNESVSAAIRRVRVAGLDIMGRSAVPRETADGFKITAAATAGVKSLSIGRGRIYVDGILVENAGPLPAPDQNPPRAFDLVTPRADGIGSAGVLGELMAAISSRMRVSRSCRSLPTMPDGNGPHLVYLDVRQREVTAVEDDSLLEPARWAV